MSDESAASNPIEHIRRFVSDRNIAPATLARAAGLHANTLRDLNSPDWNPRWETIEAVEKAIAGWPRPEAA